MKKIAKDDLIPGDHIYVRRGGLIYSHHGIYAGEGTVFHFKGIAQGHLSEKGYSLPFNNCEHFATYCATGKKKSKQVRRAIGSFVTITVFAASSFIIKAITRKKQG